MITIQKAELSHLPWIAALEQTAFSVPWSLESLTAEIKNPDADVTVAFADETLAGFCMIRYMADEGELFQIAVEPAYRGQHIGKRLLTHALQKAQRKGCTRIFLEVRASNQAALGLYANCGFAVVGTRKNYYDRPVEDAVLQCRNLTDLGDGVL